MMLSIEEQIEQNLSEIESSNDVTIIKAIESGSRAWGFPSPDSDYDVRFIYAHPKDWYIQLNEQRDVIERPIDAVLDISGWDIRKAINLANRGNAVVQEWLLSPIVYRACDSHAQISSLIAQAFDATASYHHYRAMAKKALLDIESSEVKKLKRFFYFARATLCAAWCRDQKTMPSIVFDHLLIENFLNKSVIDEIHQLVEKKAEEPESSTLEVPTEVFSALKTLFTSLPKSLAIDARDKVIISNDDFRGVLSNL